MGSKTKVVDTTPQQTKDFRDAVGGYIIGNDKSGIGSKINAQVPTTVMGSTIANAPGRDTVRDVTAKGTDSVDKLGGANSSFFQNMTAQLQPSFTQARTEGLAAAKEAAGGLTGSGFANRLGASINRSLGNEQATLANYALQGIGLEQNRQANDANRFLQAAMSNQAVDQNFLNQLFAQNYNQAQLNQQANLANYQGQLATNLQNANNFASLLGNQASLGVTPATVQQSQGFGGFLGSTLGTIAGAAAGPIGSTIGAKVGGKIGGLF